MFGKITLEKILAGLEKDVKKILKVKKVPQKNLVTELSVSSITVFEIFLKFEQTFKVCFDEYEVTMDNLNDLPKLAEIIMEKIKNA